MRHTAEGQRGMHLQRELEEYMEEQREKEAWEQHEIEEDIAALKDAERCMELRIEKLKGQSQLKGNDDKSKAIKALEARKNVVNSIRRGFENQQPKKK